jgi:hypothetical protein
LARFKDVQGRDWDVVVDVVAIKQVRSALSVDLAKLFESEAKKVFGDPCLLVDVLFVLCRDQCEGRKLSDIDFGRSLGGDSLKLAGKALADAVIDFFPSDQQAPCRELLAKDEAIRTAALTQVLEHAKQIDPTKVVEQMKAKQPTQSESPTN